VNASSLPPPVAPFGGSLAAGWYADPWNVAPWRWWSGTAWTAYTSAPVGGTAGNAGTVARKPRLPAWLSVPVVVCAVPMVPLIVLTLVSGPLALPLGLIPLAIVAPALLWFDRVEPEPRSSKVHAFLWGALVATFIALIANETGGAVVGRSFAMAGTAPVFEEAMKGLGILWAVRRREVNDVMDGIVYAGWVGLGFAVAEDFFYLVTAGGHSNGQLIGVAIFRTVVTPFAHPLFTSWTGLAVGLAVARKKTPWKRALWGFALAVATHAAWNGSIVLFQDHPGRLVFVFLLFVALFVAAAVVSVRIRNAEKRRFLSMVPALAATYGLTEAEIRVFGSMESIRAARGPLDKVKRRAFGSLHGGLAQLASLHARGGEVDSVEEALLAGQVSAALTTLR
jgi:protease PrsW